MICVCSIPAWASLVQHMCCPWGGDREKRVTNRYITGTWRLVTWETLKELLTGD